MTDYSKMSDFEINKCVAKIYGGFALTLAVHNEPPSGKSFDPGRFDPCNNPVDAWPIIHEHGISIAFDSYEDEWVAWGEFSFEKSGWDMSKEPEISYAHTNPLYAAMIVFLKMQESKNAKIPSERDS